MHHNIIIIIIIIITEAILCFAPVAVDTVKNRIPDDGFVKHPKHVE